MGNTTATAASSPRAKSPRSFRRRVSLQSELRSITSAGRSRVRISEPETTRLREPPRRQRGQRLRLASLPRDPTTGRYLPRRKVEVEVISTPQSEIRANVETERAVRTRRSPRASLLNAAPSSPPVKSRSPPPPPAGSKVTFSEKRATSPILRSSYTRSPPAEAEQQEVPTVTKAPRRARSSTPPAVSRRDYASPSLVKETMGPATVRRVRRMATSAVKVDTPQAPTTTLSAPPPPPQVERLAHSPAKQSDMTELLFSYLNAP